VGGAVAGGKKCADRDRTPEGSATARCTFPIASIAAWVSPNSSATNEHLPPPGIVTV
jgi:hypothetical protein